MEITGKGSRKRGEVINRFLRFNIFKIAGELMGKEGGEELRGAEKKRERRKDGDEVVNGFSELIFWRE